MVHRFLNSFVFAPRSAGQLAAIQGGPRRTGAAGTIIGGPLGDRFGRKYAIWISILGVAQVPRRKWLAMLRRRKS
jgi:hypothetical protein